MKQTINIHQFRDAFQAQRPNQFSYSALSALFDYLEEFEQDTGDEIEFDVVALCCEWSEYSSAINAAEVYGWDFSSEDPDNDFENERQENKALEKLRDNTQVIQFDGGILVQDF